jgi:hypothetical protein
MPRLLRRAFLAAAVSLAALPRAADAQTAPLPPVSNTTHSTTNSSNTNIFDPNRAPLIIIQIGARRYVLVPRTEGSATSLGASAIESKPNNTSLTAIIASSVAGAASAPSGEIHIRGSHGQYSYYLDGAPLPSNVSGSFSDLINPKDIQTLRIYTGGFPAEYGGQLAAIFDVTAKVGAGKPSGFLQQIAQSYSDYQSTAQVGGGDSRFSYFLSGVRSSSNFRLSPLTQTPLHDAGLENVGFGKFDLQSGPSNRFTLDVGSSAATIQVPNDYFRQAVGQDDNQKENGDFANLIWSHLAGADNLRVAFYSHKSQLRYFGSPQDLLPDSGSTDTSGLTTTNENEQATYLGLRTDYIAHVGKSHKVQLGFDVNTVNGQQFFNSFGVPQPDPTTDQPTILDARHLSGGDKSAYAQDDWTTGRTLINYGLRYDVHQSDVTTSQLSPRLNLTYTAGKNAFHAYYDRLFQPVPVEDVIKLQGASTAPAQPERDDFFEVGETHTQSGTTLSLDGYYRAEKNTIDDQTFGATQIDLPVNFAKGYTRGLEASLDGPLVKNVSYYANYARSWAKGAGPIIGGLLGEAPTGYFYDDHDQTNTASFGVSYSAHRSYTTLDGEYGSGFPYGEIDRLDANGNPILDDQGNPFPTQLNYIRVPVHTILNFGIGTTLGSTQIAFTVDNLLNHGYVIKQAGAFSDIEWGQGRAFGVKLTQNF